VDYESSKTVNGRKIPGKSKVNRVKVLTGSLAGVGRGRPNVVK